MNRMEAEKLAFEWGKNRSKDDKANGVTYAPEKIEGGHGWLVYEYRRGNRYRVVRTPPPVKGKQGKPPPSAGTLIVDGSIVADKIPAGSITTSNISITLDDCDFEGFY